MRRSSPDWYLRAQLPYQRLAGEHAGLHVGQVRLDKLEVADGGTALGGGGGVRDRLVEGPAGGADRDRGDVHPAAGQRRHRGLVADFL